MAPGLTWIGYIWSIVSLIAAAIVCTGFYTPYWLKGALTQRKLKFTSGFISRNVSFKHKNEQTAFRATTIPAIFQNRSRQVAVSSSAFNPDREVFQFPQQFAPVVPIPTYFGCFRRCNYWTTAGIKELCGRYSNFQDIPSSWWQTCTIVTGTGCAVAVLIAFITIPACCSTDIVSRSSGRALGIGQVFAAVLICCGCITFPLGWDSDEVKATCGDKSGRFVLGTCVIGWSYYLLIGGACLLYICASLSTISGKPIEWNEMETQHKTISV